MSDKHPNSKTVYIYRTKSYLDSIQTQALDFMSMSQKSIGPYWQSVNSKIVGSGLTYAEQELLMPHLIDAEPGDRDFRSKVKQFFEDMLTNIPYGDGRAFEIGLEGDNSKPVARGNMPIDIMDYVRFRHAKGHPQVAASRDAAIGNANILFYIYDPVAVEARMVATNKLRDGAMATYLSIKDKDNKVSELLTLMGTDPREFEGVNAAAQRAVALREKIEKDPETFNKIYNLDNFELRSRIQGFINTGVFRTVGDKIFEASGNKLIANSMEDAVKVLQAPEYSDNMTIWLSAYQDIMAKPLKKGRKPEPTA